MSFENSFKGKVVIVTGGGRGIGRGVCVKLHKLGAKVYAVSRNPKNLKSLQEECPGIEIVAVDLANWEATREAIEKIETVDMLVNNAGIAVPGNFFQTTEKNFDDTAAVNLKAVINVSQIVTQKMIAAKKAGSIVNVSSLAGLKAFPTNVVYGVLKAGLDHLTKIMAVTLGPSNIRVNSVNPGPVQTDMWQNFADSVELADEQKTIYDILNQRTVIPQKVAHVDEIANTILFLLSDATPMITGTLLPIEGGFNIS